MPIRFNIAAARPLAAFAALLGASAYLGLQPAQATTPKDCLERTHSQLSLAPQGVAAHTSLGPASFPSANFPELYGYEPGTVVFRGQSAALDRLGDLESYLDIDDPAYNGLKPEKRLAELRALKAEKGGDGLMRHQARQGRTPLTDRLSMAVSEDLGQVLLQEQYGKTRLGGSEPTLQILASITPDPSRDPLLLSRKVAPSWAQKEAGLVVKPRPETLRWHLVMGFGDTLETYEILDRKALTQHAKRWHAQAGSHHGATGSLIAADIPELIRRKVLREDPVLPAVARFDSQAIFLDRTLRSLFRGEEAFESAAEMTADLRAAAEKLRPHLNDPRVHHALQVLKDRMAIRLAEALPEHRENPDARAALAGVSRLLVSLGFD